MPQNGTNNLELALRRDHGAKLIGGFVLLPLILQCIGVEVLLEMEVAHWELPLLA